MVDVGNAGTVLRFVPRVAALAVGDVAFDGDPRARERPVGPLLTALRELGALIDDGDRGALPFTVHGRGAVPGGAVTLDAFRIFTACLRTAAGRRTVRQGRGSTPSGPARPFLTSR